MKNLAAFILSIITSLASFAGTTDVKVDLTNLIAIAEDPEQPVAEPFLHFERANLTDLIQIDEDEEQPVSEKDLPVERPEEVTKAIMKLHMDSIASVEEESEPAAEDLPFMKNEN